MSRRKSSLFDQALDRSVFVTYFLGAIVPLIGLAVLSERSIPSLGDRDEQLALVGAVIGTGLLSFGSFLALRRIVSRTVLSMSEQNQRLESLVLVARELAEAPHAQVVADSTAVWAQRLTQADASWVLSRPDLEKPFDVQSQRGEEASEWLESQVSEWTELLDRRTPDDDVIQVASSASLVPSVVITPLAGEHEAEMLVVVARMNGAFSRLEIDALCTLAAQAGVAVTNAEQGDSQRNFFSHMTDFVVAALDTHIQCRAGHASRVAENANRVGRAMGLEDRALHDLHFAALLHDIGMLRIPASQQRNPEFFKKHATVGYKMLSRIRVWQDAAPIVAQHHERLDGKGYPDGLVGDDICLGARILAVCDAWDAMRTEDVDRPAIEVEDALAELHAHVDRQFDPDVVRALEAIVREGEA